MHQQKFDEAMEKFQKTWEEFIMDQSEENWKRHAAAIDEYDIALRLKGYKEDGNFTLV